MEETRSFLLHRDLLGVGSMTATHMKLRAKPLVSFLPTPWFLPMNRLRLLALRKYSEAFHGGKKSRFVKVGCILVHGF
jgi:hypothetical protein